MATTIFRPVNFHAPQSSQYMDSNEMEKFLDFGSYSPTNASSSKMPMPQIQSTLASPASTILALDAHDDHQTPVAPSHDYDRFKQQTGLPSGSMNSLRALSQDQAIFNNYNTGLDDFGLSTSMYDGMGSNGGLGSMTGDLGFDSDMNASAMPTFFYPTADHSEHDDFIDPMAIQKQEEAQANMRYYPGMHQQAALKAQQQAQHQRQQAARAHQQKQREAEPQQHRTQGSRRPSHVSVDPHAEETIARVVNQIRQSSTLSAGDESPDSSSILPHIIRSKKEEDEMDEDERLLNSEEGKKLSSKERRQLRNKVSARAFRSRRKEYIGQLEGELAVKANEANELKVQNRALMEENSRFRLLSEKLLSHSAFRPFLDEISRDPEWALSLSKIGDASSQSVATTTQSSHKDTNPYSSGAQQFMHLAQNQHVGMVMMPEPQIDFSSLNLGGSSWALSGGVDMNNFQSHQVFAVIELPEPAEPIDVAALSCKSYGSVVESLSNNEHSKYDCPAEIETPEIAKEHMILQHDRDVDEAIPASCSFDENDPAFTLYASTSSSNAEPTTMEFPIALNEKPSHFEMIIDDDCDIRRSSDRLAKLVARMNASCRKFDASLSSFGF